MKSGDPVRYAIPFFIALIIAEMIWARRRKPVHYEPGDTLLSLALGLGSTAAGFLTAGLVFAAALWLWQFRLMTIGWTWWALALCFVLDDFNYYWAHRTGHRVRWFWASHVKIGRAHV